MLVGQMPFGQRLGERPVGAVPLPDDVVQRVADLLGGIGVRRVQQFAGVPQHRIEIGGHGHGFIYSDGVC